MTNQKILLGLAAVCLLGAVGLVAMRRLETSPTVARAAAPTDAPAPSADPGQGAPAWAQTPSMPRAPNPRTATAAPPSVVATPGPAPEEAAPSPASPGMLRTLFGAAAPGGLAAHPMPSPSTIDALHEADRRSAAADWKGAAAVLKEAAARESDHAAREEVEIRLARTLLRAGDQPGAIEVINQIGKNAGSHEVQAAAAETLRQISAGAPLQ